MTVQRPESIDDYHKLYRESYDLCAGIRKSKSLPPPAPLVPPSPGYVIQRDTYVGDGAATYVKNEYFTYKVASEGETPTCESGERKAWALEVTRDGSVYRSGAGEDGTAYTNPPDEAPPREQGRDDAYTERKVVKGFAVKCMKLGPDTDNLLTEQCAVDLQPGTLCQGRRPIVVAGRVTIVEKLQGAILTEPMVVKVGHRVDKRLFEAARTP
ncbi:hypothetical protein HH212_19210 [Massilia forsythiae]|uniref:Uncharacterized protein n=1 Tax=Massilia forsythiae TaxID=2728020 RepID=A0A7Z2ZU35_9BURK|nr:hypothetical protein [Massilia forsythiae]QJE01885.1 hypothetical protein HH212_19210 [Massilia forsythiae]